MNLGLLMAVSRHIAAYSDGFNLVKELVENVEHGSVRFTMSTYFYEGERGIDVRKALHQLGLEFSEDDDWDSNKITVTIQW